MSFLQAKFVRLDSQAVSPKKRKKQKTKEKKGEREGGKGGHGRRGMSFLQAKFVRLDSQAVSRKKGRKSYCPLYSYNERLLLRWVLISKNAQCQKEEVGKGIGYSVLIFFFDIRDLVFDIPFLILWIKNGHLAFLSVQIFFLKRQFVKPSPGGCRFLAGFLQELLQRVLVHKAGKVNRDNQAGLQRNRKFIRRRRR